METIRTTTVEVDIMKDRTKSFIVAKSYVLNIPGEGHYLNPPLWLSYR